MLLPVWVIADVIPPEFVGPVGVAVVALVAVGVLWRDHARQDARRDLTIDKLTEAQAEVPDAIRALTDVVKDISDDRRTSDSRDRDRRSGDRG